MMATTTRRRFLAKVGWAGMGILVCAFTTTGVASARSLRPGAASGDSARVMRQGWLLNQDDH